MADLAENAPVRGCMILKPYGYSIWENIQKILDKKIKDTGHKNAYFPIFIPKSYFSKEAEHVDGFAKECAIVTHCRLKQNDNNIIVDPESQLDEEYIIRPTSETIIWNSFSKWIRSYRDLPMKINQWANVCRWEMRTRPFLRTSEFLWQEGHTAHTTRQEALEEVMTMLDTYYDFGKEYLAIPFIKGRKTENEKFAGADETYTLEALMKDGKALQCGTSHLLGQHFSKSFDVKYLNKNNSLEYVWGTSWGISTRIIGALIMTHGDDKGLILPPKIAPVQIVIVPIFNDVDELNKIKDYIKVIIDELEKKDIAVEFDDREEYRPGYKFNEWEIKGVPLRIVVGMNDIKNNTIELVRRDTFEKLSVNIDTSFNEILKILDNIQDNLYNMALSFRENHTFFINDYSEFKDKIKKKDGFIFAHWDGSTITEQKIKEETQATIRCVPLNVKQENGKCIYSNRASEYRVMFAQNY